MGLYSSEHINATPDPIAVQELMRFIESDSDLYRQQYSPINKNLTVKKAQGKYDSAKAAVLFGYLVESGAKKYAKEGGVVMPWHEMFPKKVRDGVAKALRDTFETEHDLGNYSEFVPMKYREQSVKKAPVKRKTGGRRGSVSASVRGIR